MLALVLRANVPVLADSAWSYTWGATTAAEWGWANKPGLTVPVEAKIVHWVEMYYCSEADKTMELHQIGGHEYTGCVCIKVSVNFAGLLITASFLEHYDDPATIDVNEAIDVTDEWAIAIDVDGTGPSYSGYSNNPSDSVALNEPHLAGNEALLKICLTARNVDSQELPLGSPGQRISVGRIITTMVPTSKPYGVPDEGVEWHVVP